MRLGGPAALRRGFVGGTWGGRAPAQVDGVHLRSADARFVSAIVMKDLNILDEWIPGFVTPH